MVCNFKLSWKQTLYVIIMHTLIVSSSFAALLFIKHNKIHLHRYQNLPGFLFLYLYVNLACAAFAVAGREPDSNSSDFPEEREPQGSIFFIAECLSHGFGLALLVFLLSIISPKLALCLGIPAAVYFIAATVYIWQYN
ncbi:Uncharacterized protein Rs2_04078 [Raphanus sativus]|uniref:Uncharacterized protein LOC108841729 n=1 Tax=Raphanus sativus TaxID=3726 RepID=A0A6J0MC43_RAPSA|nr:uncharacterized protein LOC108841729 [Raphanus sativus]KAJ4909457.1 Uncharacterized protein Rs2_04078 [Raphanus sativus]